MKKIGYGLAAAFTLSLGLVSPGMSGQVEMENPIPHFLFPDFRKGVIIMKEGSSVPAMLNYNMLEERMVTEFNGSYRYARDPDLIDTVYIEDRIFVPVNRIFYEILSSGEITFYIQNRVTFVPEGQEVGYGRTSQTVGPTRYRRYETNPLYGEVGHLEIPNKGELKPASVFMVSRGDRLRRFTNARQLMKILPEFNQGIDQYTGSGEVNFKSAADIAALGDYLNGLAAGK